ncbi:MAG TPA: hypothetical protein VF070_17700 [Streptosporangiaceae bacterium]
MSIADVGALTELRVLARERDDWLGQQRAFMTGYRRGQRRDWPALRLLAGEGRSCSPAGHQPAGRRSPHA